MSKKIMYRDIKQLKNKQPAEYASIKEQEELTPLEIVKRWKAQIHWKKDWGWEKELSIIETALKALEIIKNKDVDVSWFRYCLEYCENDTNALKHYNKNCDKEITMEEFKLLKELL